jgi:hypothetical protein
VGTQKSEKYIPVGTVLTLVGELAGSTVSPGGFPALRGPAGRLVLRKPLEGPFLATNRSLAQLHDQLAAMSGRLRFWAAALGCVGAALVVAKLGRRVHRDWVLWRARRKLQKQLQERRQQQGEGEGEGEGEGGDEAAEPSVCTVCLEGALEMVWVPCGHMCLCQGCVPSVDRCPLCRCRGKAIKVYRP